MDNIRKLFQSALELFQLYSNSRILIRKHYWKVVLLLFIIIAWRLFADVNIRPIEYWDERTNIAVINENTNNENIWDLKYAGQSFWEKPPLWYVINIQIANNFSNNYLTVRFFNACLGLGIFTLIFYLQYKFHGKKSALFSIIFSLAIHQFYISNAGGYFSSHIFSSADLDTLQIFLLVLSQFTFWNSIDNKKLIWFIATYIILGLAWLAKGPLIVLNLIAFSGYYLVTNKKNSKFNLLIGFSTFFIVVLPWYSYMVSRYGIDFLNIHFGFHLFDRAFSVIEGHQQSILFYPSILINLLTSFFGIFFLIYVYFKRNRSPLAKFNFALSIIYFSLIMSMQTKIAWYVLPLWISLLLI